MWAAFDAGLWIVASLLAVFLRFDFALHLAFAWTTLLFSMVVAVLHVVLGLISGPYAVGHSRGSLEEITDVTRTAAVATLIAVIGNALLPTQLVPRSVPLIAGLIALLAMFAARMVLRTKRSRAHVDDNARRVIVFGAGEGGRQLIRTLQRDTEAGLEPVGIIDDDPTKRRLRIDGVPVRGTRDDLLKVASQTNAAVLALAVPSADATLIRELSDRAREAQLDVMVLPTVNELFDRSKSNDLRALDLTDLLGRRPVDLDTRAISEGINGKVVLVTGAGGSIGSELCRQISRFGPRRLLMLDRDESALHAVQISITGQGLLDSDDVILADIRDAERMHEVFQQHHPDLVFHAAALKHLPLLEQYPMEAWKTNVLGTLNVLEAATASGVSTFVNVSTDKAANPGCVLGYSKRLTERLTSDFASRDDGTYVSVRFGNVLGSRGSVVTAFTAQIEQGGPVTVTHPDVERYFMLIPEACQLVLQAAVIGTDGQVMVLDMGTPSKIVDVAHTLIELSGREDVEIVYTGLRPGEKMSEELFTPGEDIRQSAHPLVSHVDVPSITPAVILEKDQHPAPDVEEFMHRETVADFSEHFGRTPQEAGTSE